MIINPIVKIGAVKISVQKSLKMESCVILSAFANALTARYMTRDKKAVRLAITFNHQLFIHHLTASF
ncbi:MAG: hypothetical protein ACI8R1_001811 [Psychrobacter glaciei]|jgi:hypothetical protein